MSEESARPSAEGAALRACANHPQVTAVLTCTRCGDYACPTCAGSMFAQQPLCKRCSGGDHEARRKELGPHERQVRGIALYYWLAAAGLGLGEAAAFIPAFAEMIRRDDDEAGFTPHGLLFMAVVVTVFVTLFGAAAWQLQRFTKAGQVLGVIAAVPGLCSIPIGTLIRGFSLWALLSKQGQAVFMPEYRAVVAAMPHLKYGVSTVSKIALVVLVVLLVVAVWALLWRDIDP